MDLGPPKSSMQYRPKGSPDARQYNPQRDIVWSVPHLMEITTQAFYRDHAAHDELEEAIGRQLTMMAIAKTGPWADGKRPSESELEAFEDQQINVFSEMCVTIGKGFCQHFMRGDRTFTEALKAAGLEKFPSYMLDLWLKHFGHTVISAFYYGCRDCLMKDADDPMDYNKIFAAAEEIRWHMRGVTNA